MSSKSLKKSISFITIFTLLFSIISPVFAGNPSFDDTNIYAFINSNYLTGGNLDLAKSNTGYLVDRGANGWGINSGGESGNDKVEVNNPEIIAFDLGTGSGAYTVSFDVKHSRDNNYNYENFVFKAYKADKSPVTVTASYSSVNPSKAHVVLNSTELFQYVAMIGGTDGLNIVLDGVTTVDVIDDVTSNSTVLDGTILGFTGSYTLSGKLDLSLSTIALVNQKNGTNYIGTVGGAFDYSIDAVGEGLVFVMDGITNSVTYTFKSIPTLYTIELYDQGFNLIGSGTTAPDLINTSALTTDSSNGFKYIVVKYNGDAMQLEIPFISSGESEARLIGQDINVNNLNGPLNESGDIFKYIYTFTNPGNTTLEGVHFTLDIPTKFESLSSIAFSGGTDASATTGGANGQGYIDISGITLSVGEYFTVSYQVTATGTTYPDTIVTNTSVVWPNTSTGTTTLTGTLSVDFGVPSLSSSISITDLNGGTLVSGDCIKNDATITNTGTAIGNNLSVTLNYGTGTTFQTASGFTFTDASLDGSTIGSSILTDSMVVDSPYPTITFTITDLPVNIPEIFYFYTCVNAGYDGTVAPSIDAGIDGGITVTETSDPITAVSTNNTPTNITLSSSTIDENSSTGTLVGTLSTTDADGGDSHIYTLVSGTGDTDNGSFTLSGSELLSGENFDFEIKTSYSVRIKTDDTNGGTFEKAFTIGINNLDEISPVITLNGTGSTIEFGSSYTDLGAEWSDNVDGTGSLVASGTVDTGTLGSYVLTYDKTDVAGNVAIQVSRTVIVVDTTLPVITLSGSTIVNIVKNAGFTDDGASWVDNVDGTGSINVTNSGSVNTTILGTYPLEYIYVDTSGNTGSVLRTVNVIAGNTAVITLNGSGTLNHEFGTTYTDLGALYSDVEDGTGSVVGSGMVDINTLGVYVLTYDFTDSSGNISSQVTRTVTVVDTTAPLDPTIIGPTEGQTLGINTPTLTGTGEIGAIFEVRNGSGVLLGTGTVSGTGGYSFVSGILPEGGNTFKVKLIDLSGNTSGETVVNFVVDTGAPTITPGTLTGTTTETTAVISWQTNEPTSSEIIYGLTTIINQTSGEQDIAPRVTSHSLTLTGLEVCTKYYYKTVSRDASGNELIDGVYDFITKGCAGDAEVLEVSSTDIVLTASGATGTGGIDKLSIGTGSKLLEVEVPINYFDVGTGSCAGTGVYFQFKEIEKIPVVNSFGTPLIKIKALRTYDLSAYCTADERIHNFDSNLTISMSYSDSDIVGIIENTVSIYSYNTVTTAWEELTNCSIDIANNIVTCETNHFSTFGVFGDDEVVVSSGGGTKRKDYCPDGDYSRTYYDRECGEKPEEELEEETGSGITSTGTLIVEEKEVVLFSEEEEKSEEIFDDTFSPEVETNVGDNYTTKTRDIEGKDITYYLKDSYQTCNTIDNILNKDYINSFDSILNDIEGLENKDLIQRLEKAEVVDGTIENNFEPSKNILRTEFLKIVLRSHCIEYRNENPEDLDFIDLDNTTWQAKVIKKSIDLGLVVGDLDENGNKIFRSDDEISKIEATKILLRMALIQMGDEPNSNYYDIEVNWHNKYINQGEYLGVFNPEMDNNLFTPEIGVDRQSMVDFLFNVIRLYR